MLKLHLVARVAVTLGATVFIAGSASATSTSSGNDFTNFFESIFDNDSNGGRRVQANLGTDDLTEVSQSVSFLGSPEEEDGRRVTGGGAPGEEDFDSPPVNVSNLGGRRVDGTNPVPEPSAGVLFGLGALLVRRRLRR